MSGEEQIGKKLEELAQAIGGDQGFVENVMSRVDKVAVSSNDKSESRVVALARRLNMKGYRRLAAAALLIVAVALMMTFLNESGGLAYALEQTIEAMQNARFLHVVSHDEAGRITDERWIEIGMDGRQVCYRQEHPMSWLLAFQQTGEVAPDPTGDLSMVPMVIEDGETTALYRYDKEAVVLYDREDRQYQWVGDLGGAFENLRQKGKILEENVDYEGRAAHKVWWPSMNGECYIDPRTKLPITLGGSRLSYEQPAPETFDIVVPDGYVVLDQRDGSAAADAPEWLVAEENVQEQKTKSFRRGANALATGNYAEAARLLEQGIGADSWAWFWLGRAYYELGQYDLAIENYNALLDVVKKVASGEVLEYCRYARGLAYTQLGMTEAAKADFDACLPAMMRTLRIPSAGSMFEYADNPLIRYGQYKPSEAEMVANTIARLRIVTGQDFGFDPNGTEEEKEAAIAAWEQWYQDLVGNP